MHCMQLQLRSTKTKQPQQIGHATKCTSPLLTTPEIVKKVHQVLRTCTDKWTGCKHASVKLQQLLVRLCHRMLKGVWYPSWLRTRVPFMRTILLTHSVVSFGISRRKQLYKHLQEWGGTHSWSNYDISQEGATRLYESLGASLSLFRECWETRLT